MKKIILIILLSFTFISIKVSANEEYIEGAKAGILIEETTKTILYEKKIHEKLPPASMTKIMTMLLVFEAIENNIIGFDTELITSDYAASMGGTQVYLKVGEKITVHEALKCVAIASANDCAVLLAESVSGSEKEFVRNMNNKAKNLNAINTNFADCTGLTEENHYTTSYDLALISIELTTKYPKVFEYTNLKEDYIRKDTSSPFWLVNTNKLVGRVDGILGLKTGHIAIAGYCITLYMKKDNITVISVVFGYDTSQKRNSESLELLRYGVNNYKLNTIIGNNTVLEEVDHILYKDKIKILIKEDIAFVDKRKDNNDYLYEYNYNLTDSKGILKIKKNNEIILEKEIVIDDVEKKNFFELISSLILIIIR